MRILESKELKVKNKSPYENDDPTNEMIKFTISSLLDHPQTISLKILENMMHSYKYIAEFIMKCIVSNAKLELISCMKTPSF